MPSRPMFTTPARSDHSPPRPARPIGTAAASAAPMAPAEVRSSAPVTTRTSDSTTSPAATRIRMTGKLIRRARTGPARHATRRRRHQRVGAHASSCPGRRGAAASSSMAGLTGSTPGLASELGGNLRRDHLGLAGRDTDAALLLATRHPGGELVGDDDREHRDALHDDDGLLRDVLEIQDDLRPVEERPQQGGEHDADRIVAAEQRDRDAGEAQATDRGRHRVLAAEQLGQADQAGHRRPRAASCMSTILRALTPLATAAARVHAGGPQVEAEPGPSQQEPVAEADQGGHHDEAEDRRRGVEELDAGHVGVRRQQRRASRSGCPRAARPAARW